MFLGYDTIMIEDGTGTTSPDFCVEARLYNVKLLFGFVTQSASILKAPATRNRIGRSCRSEPLSSPTSAWPRLGSRCRRRRTRSPASCPSADHGRLVYLAGQVCEWNGDVRFVGRSATT